MLLLWLLLFLNRIALLIIVIRESLCRINFEMTWPRHFVESLKQFNRYILEQFGYVVAALCTNLHELDIYVVILLFPIVIYPLFTFLVWNFTLVLIVEITLIAYYVIEALLILFWTSHFLLLLFAHITKPSVDAFKTVPVSYVVYNEGDSNTPIIHFDHASVHFLASSIPNE